jgi:isoleucyl-tRNA synthetase
VLAYERVRDETGREMHKSWGNAIEANEAFERMGADVVRWLFTEHLPHQNINFGYGPAEDVKRRLLTLWNSVSFFVTYANIERFLPRYGELETGPEGELRPLDRWLVARTQQFLGEAERAYERFWTPAVVRAFESFVDDISNWYIRRSRPRFWDADEAALRTLWYALVQALRAIAPVLPFLADHLWRNVAGAAAGAPASVFLAGWPQARDHDGSLLEEMAETRRIVGLGHTARKRSVAKVRQPLRRLVVAGAQVRDEYVDVIKDELNVKDVEFGEVEAEELVVRPNLPVLGPRLGKELGPLRAALAAGEFEELGDGRFRAAGHELAPGDVLVERRGKQGWAVASEDGVTVALDTELDPELEREGRLLDLIHRLNAMRKEAGLELTDRIVVTLPRDHGELLRHVDRIKHEVLAVEVRTDGISEPEIEKAEP